MHNFRTATYIGVIPHEAVAPTGVGAVKEREAMSRNINTLVSRYRRWRRYRETVRELQGLSTHELSDLGIRRGEIGRLAREASRL